VGASCSVSQNETDQGILWSTLLPTSFARPQHAFCRVGCEAVARERSSKPGQRQHGLRVTPGDASRREYQPVEDREVARLLVSIALSYGWPMKVATVPPDLCDMLTKADAVFEYREPRPRPRASKSGREVPWRVGHAVVLSASRVPWSDKTMTRLLVGASRA
jgi:hypothetical protein